MYVKTYVNHNLSVLLRQSPFSFDKMGGCITLSHPLRQARVLLLLLPSALLLLTCIAGPLNGSMRYSFGFIAAFPIVAGALIHDIEVSGGVEAERQRA